MFTQQLSLDQGLPNLLNLKNELEETNQLSERAVSLLEQAALQHGHPMALVQLGNMALERAANFSETNEQKDEIEKSMGYFQRAGEAGSTIGWFNLGQLFWTGFPPMQLDGDKGAATNGNTNEDQVVRQNRQEAVGYFMKAIDQGDLDAMYLVGVHRLTEGNGDEMLQGLSLLEQAAIGGHGGALYYISLLHLNGNQSLDIQPCSKEEFVERLNRAVQADNLDATFTRGHSYFHGTDGYTQNYKRALKDFLAAAENGHADAAVSGKYRAVRWTRKGSTPHNSRRIRLLQPVRCYMLELVSPKTKIEPLSYIRKLESLAALRGGKM